jgi:glycosyltransferase involved in cell wall biosynthesis
MIVTEELFIGVTSWNSEKFLPHCLESLYDKNSEQRSKRVVVLDNCSMDSSPDVARSFGAEVIIKKMYQWDALNLLLSISRSKYTLLIHSDVIFLSSRWYEACLNEMKANVALISPQDIGCGPYTRPWGQGMPESSFMLFDTAKIRKARSFRWVRRFRLRLPVRRLDLYHPHVTHNLPSHLQRKGLAWVPMKVHTSKKVERPIYQRPAGASVWNDELACLQYGMGNFCSIGGIITHYHNWFERALDRTADPEETLRSVGIPLEYIRAYSDAFIEDYRAHNISLPDVTIPERVPRAI